MLHLWQRGKPTRDKRGKIKKIALGLKVARVERHASDYITVILTGTDVKDLYPLEFHLDIMGADEIEILKIGLKRKVLAVIDVPTKKSQEGSYGS